MEITDIALRLTALLALTETSPAAAQAIKNITLAVTHGEDAVRKETEQRVAAKARAEEVERFRAELSLLIDNEKAFIAACQKHMGLPRDHMQPFFRNLTSRWSEGGEDVVLAQTFLRLLGDAGVELNDLVFSHPQWKEDLRRLGNYEKGAAWYGTMNHYCRALFRHLSGNNIQAISHPEAWKLTDEEVRAMSKDEFFDLLLFSDFSAHPGRRADGMKLIRGEYWGDGYIFQLHRFPSGSFARLISNPPC